MKQTLNLSTTIARRVRGFFWNEHDEIYLSIPKGTKCHIYQTRDCEVYVNIPEIEEIGFDGLWLDNDDVVWDGKTTNHPPTASE